MRITFATCCMDRLEHLQETLPANIEAAREALNDGTCEWLVLDYGSKQDRVQEWLSAFPGDDLRGKLRCFRAEARWWNASKAHNILVRQARGEWHCNVDADNYIGRGFVEFLLDHVATGTFLSALDGEQDHGKKCFTVAGRICVEKQVLEEMRGYDELNCRLDDWDLRNRLKASGLQMTRISNPSFLKAIHHQDRLKNHENKNWDEVRGRTAITRIKERRKAKLPVNPDGWGAATDLRQIF